LLRHRWKSPRLPRERSTMYGSRIYQVSLEELR
jgi:hypothetical protein